MRHIIHVHQQRIRQGLDAIIDRTYKGSTYSRRRTIVCPECAAVVGAVVQSDMPDRCGARVWIEVQA